MILDIALVGPGRMKPGASGVVSTLMDGPLYEAALDYATHHYDEVYLLIPERGLMSPYAICHPLSVTLLDLGPTRMFLWARDVIASLRTRHPVTYLSLSILASPLYGWPLTHYLEQEEKPYWDWQMPLDGLSYQERIYWLQEQKVFHV